MIVDRTTYLRCWLTMLAAILSLAGGGCAAFRPMHGIPARFLPDDLHAVARTGKRTIDLSLLSQTPPPHYLVDTGDVLAVYIEGILPKREEGSPVYVPGPDQQTPGIGVPITVRDDGTISLPLVGTLVVRNRTVPDVEELVRRAYTGKLHDNQEFLSPGRERILVSLQKPRLYRVLVLRQEGQGLNSQVSGSTFSLGELKRGTGKTVSLPAYKNDVLHALAETGGLPGLDAENAIYVIRGKNTMGLRGQDCSLNAARLKEGNADRTSQLIIRGQSGDSFWEPGLPAAGGVPALGSIFANEIRRTPQMATESGYSVPQQGISNMPVSGENAGVVEYPAGYSAGRNAAVVQDWGRSNEPDNAGPMPGIPAGYSDRTYGMPIQPPANSIRPTAGNNSLSGPGVIPIYGPGPSQSQYMPPQYMQSQMAMPRLAQQPDGLPQGARPVGAIPHGAHSLPDQEQMPRPMEMVPVDSNHGLTNIVNPRKHMIRIPIRLGPDEEIDLTEDDVRLDDGDIVFIESRDTEIFYTGGLLGGGQYPLPRDYDLDILGAIAISQSRFSGGGGGGTRATQSIGGQSALNNDVSISASTAMVLRPTPDGQQVPIRVDLYRALRDPTERILIQPGDYIMLQYTPAEAIMAFIERHLLEGALFGVAAAQLNTGSGK